MRIVGHELLVPDDISFAESAFRAWHEMADTVRLVIHFALAVRYLNDLDSAQKIVLADVLQDNLGHIPFVQALLAQPVDET